MDRLAGWFRRIWEADQRFSGAIEEKVNEHLVGPVVERVQQTVLDKLWAWLQPSLVALLPALWPIAYISAAIGILLVTVGLRRLGFRIVRWSIAGYFLLLIVITLIGGGLSA